MSQKIQAVRGMHDVLPGKSVHWQYLEQTIQALVQSYGYREIRFPIVEKTDLFKRTIGEVTDIVEKEMYVFDDRNGESLTLRPEGTAGAVRSGVEQGYLYNQIQRLWYIGPMFRYEKPQKGRYRQFHQLGVEAFGMAGPDIDAELILLSNRLWKTLGLEGLRLEINSLGSAEARNTYRTALVEYLTQFQAELDDDSQRRLSTNPLRILDSKNPSMQEIIEAAPKLADYLDEESKAHFDGLCDLLNAAGIEYSVNPRLVRGLDYYGKTVFEWVTDQLGAQGTVCAGGRYDGLVEQLGGKANSAIGFAIGLERLLALLEDNNKLPEIARPDAYFALVGDEAVRLGTVLSERLRDVLPALTVLVNCGGGSFKNQLKKADRSGANVAIIMGDDEADSKSVIVKYLRDGQDQKTVSFDELIELLQANEI